MPRKPDNPDRHPAVTRRDLSILLHQRTLIDLPTCHRIVDNVVELIVEALVSGAHVRLRGLGSLALYPIKDRVVRLPHQPDKLAHVKGRPRVKFYEAGQLVAALKRANDPAHRPQPDAPGTLTGRPFGELFAGRRRHGQETRGQEAPAPVGANGAKPAAGS